VNVDTIAALSTAPGVGAIAVVRVSGPDAFGVLGAGRTGAGRTPARRTGSVTSGDPRPGVFAGRRRSYRPRAGDPLPRVPIATRVRTRSRSRPMGGCWCRLMVLDACLSAGARQAEPGEFTRRAYLNGRMDLVQAEAVSDVIHARSRALHRASVLQLDRGLSDRVGATPDRARRAGGPTRASCRLP
jgi:tRNA modification GTPase